MSFHKIKFDFKKKKNSLTTIEFMLGIFNPAEEDAEQKDNLQRALEGGSLKVKEANLLIQQLFTAMVINDNEGDEEILNELNEKEAVGIHTDHKPGSSGLVLPKGTAPPEIVPKTKFNTENVCHFFATNKCKFGKDCRKLHPRICNKFKKYGLAKFNKSGCSENCEFYHPKACFDSMKTKSCKRPDCKFFHTIGTKREEGHSNSNNNNNNSNNGNNGNNGNNHDNKNPGNNSGSNTYSNVNGSQNSYQTPVFHEARQPWESAIERMAAQLEKMMNIQLSFHTQIQPLLQPQRSLSN